MRRALLALVLSAASVVGLTTSPGLAADMVVGVYASDPGVCGENRVLSEVTERFRHQVNNVPKLPNVAILDFRDIGETRYEPAWNRSPIERRYCHARVALSDGDVRRVWYLIESPMGFASIGSKVEFCVAGFDRWNVYNGNCRVLR